MSDPLLKGERKDQFDRLKRFHVYYHLPYTEDGLLQMLSHAADSKLGYDAIWTTLVAEYGPEPDATGKIAPALPLAPTLVAGSPKGKGTAAKDRSLLGGASVPRDSATAQLPAGVVRFSVKFSGAECRLYQRADSEQKSRFCEAVVWQLAGNLHVPARLLMMHRIEDQGGMLVHVDFQTAAAAALDIDAMAVAEALVTKVQQGKFNVVGVREAYRRELGANPVQLFAVHASACGNPVTATINHFDRTGPFGHGGSNASPPGRSSVAAWSVDANSQSVTPRFPRGGNAETNPLGDRRGGANAGGVPKAPFAESTGGRSSFAERAASWQQRASGIAGDFDSTGGDGFLSKMWIQSPAGGVSASATGSRTQIPRGAVSNRAAAAPESPPAAVSWFDRASPVRQVDRSTSRSYSTSGWGSGTNSSNGPVNPIAFGGGRASSPSRLDGDGGYERGGSMWSDSPFGGAALPTNQSLGRRGSEVRVLNFAGVDDSQVLSPFGIVGHTVAGGRSLGTGNSGGSGGGPYSGREEPSAPAWQLSSAARIRRQLL